MLTRVLQLLILSASLLSAQSDTWTVYMIEHAIGQEHSETTKTPGGLRLETHLSFTDRANTRQTSATLEMSSDYTPIRLSIADKPNSVVIDKNVATVEENGAKRSDPVPPRFFTAFGETPFAIQAAMFRYWDAHGRPRQLPVLRGKATAPPVTIDAVGQDVVSLNGKPAALDRYTVANLAWGKEVVWLDRDRNLIAAMTFAGGLPMEAVRAGYEPEFSALYRSGVRQQMAELKGLAREVTPEMTGSFAITGATLIDGTGAPALPDSVVLIQNGRITAAGPRAAVHLPPGIRRVDAKGQALLPGLWEMHIHASGVEFGPALLAAGITTARDCGGEFDFLVAQRSATEHEVVPSPHMLLAGLVDAGGLRAFGHVTAETPEEGRTVVHRYHDAGFEQIKLYTYLTPDVVKAISAEAHRLGMSVTGHVPQALTTAAGIEAGMDQINHLNYVSRMLRPPDAGPGPIDLNSTVAEEAISFLKEHKTVVDPTVGWGEMASHSSEVDVASFEPGILHAPFVLDTKFRALGNSKTSAEQMRSRLTQNLQVVLALHQAGIPIVAGSDTGLPGYGLIRELELYVQAGLTPLQAIQAGTVVSARAMGLDRETGTVEAGKRADLVLVNGNPLETISDLRHVSKTVVGGRLYDSGKLWQSVGYHP